MPQQTQSSSTVAAWTAAVALAAFPAWDLWQGRRETEELVQEGAGEIYSCVGPYDGGSWLTPLSALRGDLAGVVQTAQTWAVPALAVVLALLAFIRGRDVGTVGRRVAGLLVVIAVVEPFTYFYGAACACAGTVPPLTGKWFGEVIGGWGTTQPCLLAAAALVYAVSRTPEPPARAAGADGADGAASGPVTSGPVTSGAVWRRAAATVIDYLIVVVAVTVVVEVVWSLLGRYPEPLWLEIGFLKRIELFDMNRRPVEWVAPAVLFLYFWAQHALWGRTLGKRLLGLRVVDVVTGGRPGARRTALRTLAFPFLALVPGVGLVCLFADALGALLDGEGQVQHDRLLGVAVVRHRRRKAWPSGGGGYP
ncbi:RDD family protein [Microbispora amethystogenes]|uniref:RDD family protein n=1 Tax=Microbispora amethystogenes TaxID=1427754 RepID=UPI0033EFC465